jgi:outer membrane protein assembly factor BamB
MSEERAAKQDEPLETDKPVPQVSVSLPETLEMTEAPAAGDPPLEVTLSVPNPGPGVLHLRLKPEPDWVTVDKPAIAIRAGEAGELKVSVAPASVTSENRARAQLKAEWAADEGGAGIGSGVIRILIPPPRRLLLCPNLACGELIHSGDLSCAHCGLALRFCPECGSAAARTAERCSAREPHALPPLATWPVIAGDAGRTGGLAELASSTLKTLWTFAFDQPGAVTGPVIAWDTVFIAGGAPPRLVALDLAAGQKLWEHALSENASLSALSAPGISGERVVIADESGMVLAVEGASGKEAWTSRLPFPTPGGCLAAGSGLFIPTAPPDGEGGHVVALWPEDGAKVWSARLPVGCALPLAARRGHVLAHGFDGTLRSLNAKDGSLAWQRPLGPPKFGPVAAESLVLASLETELIALDAVSGEERWRFAAATPITAGPATNADRVYVSAGSALHVLDATSGAKLQELTLPREQSSKPTATPAGALLVSGDALYQCSATEPACTELARIATPAAGPIGFAGGKLLVLTANGAIALGAKVDPV